MTRQYTLKLTLVVLALFWGGVSAFVLNSVFLGSGSADSTSPEGASPRIVDTIEEADSEAGYKVRVPTYIPAGFEPDGKILVTEHQTKAREKSVFQSWSRPTDGAFFLVEQSPTLSGIVEEGEEATVRGLTGEKVLYPSDTERPFEMVAFYWSEESRGVVVVGSLISGLTESEIKSVAESVQVRQ